MKEEQIVQEEIRKEFQIERMILFSDAVFAIVITLMAIEIKAPEIEGHESSIEIAQSLFKIFPFFFAYIISFAFIGHTWYQHLKIFSFVKDYDKGLIFRNLLMLFFISLFPFSASFVTKPHLQTLIPAAIYFGIVVCCRVSQLNLHHYILVKRPQLRYHADIKEEMFRYKKSKLSMILLLIIMTLVAFTYYFIESPEMKNLAWWWFIPFPFAMKYFQKRIKV